MIYLDCVQYFNDEIKEKTLEIENLQQVHNQLLSQPYLLADRLIEIEEKQYFNKNKIENYKKQIEKLKTVEIKMTEKIIEIVSIVTGVSVENILAQNRRIPYTDARKIAMSLTVRYTDLDFTVIAKEFKKDRSTVAHACRVSLDLMETDKYFFNKYLNSENMLVEAGYKLVKRKKRQYKKKKVSKKLKIAA